MATRTGRPIIAMIVVALAVLIAGCDSGGDAPNAADRRFLQEMIPHHERAIEVARIGISKASDSRVRSFAARIVREQDPELNRLRDVADGVQLDFVDGARTAHDRITDAQVADLRTLSGRRFDRRFLQLHIDSETGAADMAENEIHGGTDADALALAKPIATARTTQIPELRALLAALT